MRFNLQALILYLFKPPSLATNNVKPKHIRKTPVAISTLYNKAKYPVCKFIAIINANTIVLKIFISNLLYVRNLLKRRSGSTEKNTLYCHKQRLFNIF